ncbi:MAG: carboxypeptidase-like regulatory domain-containing protein [Bacteroidaceae bacterium]|nr:carboxypeptidase-like regulatory domain-containing protein [Bacteroidaceae bacterium]
MKHLHHFLFLLWTAQSFGQEVKLQGRVVDAETGEALPYVNIFVAEGNGTLTNIDGEFQFQATEEDVLTFSFIGYGKQRIKADKVPNIVRLKPYTTLLQEVTVLPIDEQNVLKTIIERLKKDYKESGKWTRKYFFRALIEENTVNYIAEAFMDAFSVVNIRSAEIISGLQGYDRDAGKGKLILNSSNIHKLIEVGPMTVKSNLWSGVTKPLQHFSFTKEYYDTKFQNLYGEDGDLLYRIEFSLKKKHLTDFSDKPYIMGTAYVDAETLRVLRFDGSCINCKARMGLFAYPTTIDFHLEYDYSKGAASVSNMAIHGENPFMTYRALLFAIEGDKQDANKTRASGSNIVTALMAAGFDGSLWSKYDIIKRTKEEERIAFGEKAE